MAGPLAVKILSADIPHKTDAGMVRLNVPTASLRSVAGPLLEEARAKFPAARIDGVLVQRMECGIDWVLDLIGYFCQRRSGYFTERKTASVLTSSCSGLCALAVVSHA